MTLPRQRGVDEFNGREAGLRDGLGCDSSFWRNQIVIQFGATYKYGKPVDGTIVGAASPSFRDQGLSLTMDAEGRVCIFHPCPHEFPLDARFLTFTSFQMTCSKVKLLIVGRWQKKENCWFSA